MSEHEESELIIEQIEIGPMQNFTYLVGSRSTREVVIVDPAWDIDSLIRHIAERDYILKGALVTHYHPDHCGGSMGGHRIEGISELLEQQGLKVYVHSEEAEGLKKVSGV
ncbi:MAG TPA: MBL fold metallo-hydrolase, partial [Pseudomonadales bacterium]